MGKFFNFPILFVYFFFNLFYSILAKNTYQNFVFYIKQCYVCVWFVVSIDWETHQLYMKTEMPSIVQWRATPSGSFREPVDYKEQERSNLIFSEFHRLLRTANLFYIKTCNLQVFVILFSYLKWNSERYSASH